MPTLTLTPIVKLPGRGNRYQVCLGGGTYQVDAEAGSCTCPNWVHRHSRDRSHCKHVSAVFEQLQRERACPGCQGLGIVALRSRYADTTPIPCIICDGTGLRLAAETQAAAMSNAELLELFQ